MRWARSHSTAARPVRPHWHLPLVQVRRTSIRVPLLLMRVRRWHAGQTPGFSGSVWTPLTFTVSQVYVRLESFLSRPEGGHRCRAFTRSDCVAASERLALVSTMLSSRTTATTAREGTPDMEVLVNGGEGVKRRRGQEAATVITLMFAGRLSRCRMTVSRRRAASD